MKNKVASYRAGVPWIADNDEPGEADPEIIAGFISTMLLADLFGKDPAVVGRDVARRKAAETEE